MLRAALLAAVLACLLPAAARADHVVPTVTLDSTLSEPGKKGIARQTLSWDASCGDPADEIAIGVSRVVALKGRQPAALRPQWIRQPRQGPGSLTLRVLPGTRWKPRVEIRCRHVDADEERTAFAEAPDWLYLPPRLLGWDRSAGETCGGGPGQNDRWLQERMWTEVTLEALYDEEVLLEKADEGVVLVVRGGGVRKRVKLAEPAAGSFVDPEQWLKFELPIFRRPGRARLWLEFDGDRSNAITVPIRRLPSGCEEFAAKGAQRAS